MQILDPVSTSTAATIVLAENDSEERRLHAQSLRDAGYTIWEASDGGEAVALVRAHAPALLLLDMWMPILNGLEVVELLAGTPERVGLTVVVLSHQNDADTCLEGFALGVADYWTTDMSTDELRDRVEQMLRSTPRAASPTG